MQTVLHGKHFLICDDRGDIRTGTEGLYARDERHLSQWLLLVDGRPPQPLGAPQGPHYQRAFVQRNVKGDALEHDSLIVERRYVVDDAFYERLIVENITVDELSFQIAIDAGADYHDIFQVKEEEFTKLGDDTGTVGMAGARLHPQLHFDAHADHAAIEGPTGTTFLHASRPFEVGDGRIYWNVTLAPRARWMADMRVSWNVDRANAPIEFDLHRSRVEQDTAIWLAETPVLLGGRSRLRRTYRTSVQDLAALRIEVSAARDDDSAGAGGSAAGMVPAAGLPWFMTSFGRDTLITCLQTLVLGPERAKAAIEFLASRQATVDDPEVDAEPGKILHEVREGGIAGRGYDVYYGSIDATPLFLVLLDELHRWTRDDAFVIRHKGAALAALRWIEEYGDADGDGYLEYRRRSSQGLENQSWKDSHDSQRFHDGRTATGAIAPAEAQGYAYDARMRTARLAREVWKDRALATRLVRDAEALKQRFNRDFWIQPERVTPIGPDDPRRDGFFALALDGDKQPVDALTSNIGHLLWSGIVDHDKVEAVVRQLHSRHLYNGFGIRTMSTLDAAYNPISYHNGTVWPHDTSICVAGLVRVGAYEVAGRIANATFDAATYFHGRLPEVFAGLDRAETSHPVEYPTTCSPQAWAAGAPILMITELLGLGPHPKRKALTLRHSSVPQWLEDIELRGISAFGHNWDVQVRHGIPIIERR